MPVPGPLGVTPQTAGIPGPPVAGTGAVVPPGPPRAGMPQPPMAQTMPTMPGMPAIPGVMPPTGPPTLSPTSTQAMHAPGMPGTPTSPRPPPFGGAGGPAAAQPNGPGTRIDPGQMPRPIISHAPPVEYATRLPSAGGSSGAGAAAVPLPLESAGYVAVDAGNASPRFMRPTMSMIPTTGEVLASSAIPFAILVTPFAIQHELEEPVPLVDYGETGPMRCEACKAYVNPFFRFIEHGRRVVCNMCQHVSDVRQEYMCQTGHDGKRHDWRERPELCRGSVDFVAPSSYMVRPPMPPSVIFAIEVSSAALGTGVTQAGCAAARAAIKDMANKDRALVGIITFDTAVHCYKLSATAGPKVLIVPDVGKPFAPDPGLMAPVAEMEEQLLTLLDDIPRLYAPGTGSPPCFGAAVHASIDALRKEGGRLEVIACSLPGMGVGAIQPRSGAGAAGGGESEKDPLKSLEPASADYKELASRAAELNVCIDLFLCPQGGVDAGTTMLLPRTTGGEMRLYAPWNGQLDYNGLISDVRWSSVRPVALETVMRVRCSTGLHVSEYNGSFYQPTATDLDVAAIDSDKAVMVCLRHGEKLSDVHEACFQAAVLYTTPSGSRRIRIHTASFGVTAVLGSLFKQADLECIFNYFSRWAASMLMSSSIDHTKEVLTSQLTSMLLAYRKYCAASSSSGQLILPEALKLLPLYVLGLLKSSMLSGITPPDVRADVLCRMATITAACSAPAFYARVLPISQLPIERWRGAKEAGPVSEVEELAPLPASSEALTMDGAYLIENGEEMFIYVGRDAAPELLQEIFGVNMLGDVSSLSLLSEKPNERSRQLHLLIARLRHERRRFMRLRVTRTGDPLEHRVMALMVEDRQRVGMSYVEFLCHLHRQIQAKNH